MLTHIDEPLTYLEAMEGKDREKWRVAMKEELESHQFNKTWSVVKRTKEMNVMGCKWVYKVKRDERNAIVMHKACLIA